VPEEAGLEQVIEAAREEEGPEQPVQVRVAQVAALADEGGDDEQDGGVGQKDRDVGRDVQPTELFGHLAFSREDGQPSL
jgi:hypothetical protein